MVRYIPFFTEDLTMQRMSAKFVPKVLIMELKQIRVEVSQDILLLTNGKPDFLKTMIIGDESGFSGVTRKLRGCRHSKNIHHPRDSRLNKASRCVAKSKSG